MGELTREKFITEGKTQNTALSDETLGIVYDISEELNAFGNQLANAEKGSNVLIDMLQFLQNMHAVFMQTTLNLNMEPAPFVTMFRAVIATGRAFLASLPEIEKRLNQSSNQDSN